MGNIVSGRPVASSRNKDFNSVLPEPQNESLTIKKRKLVPKEEVPEPHEKLAASVGSLPGTIQSENIDRSITYKDNDTSLEFDHTEGQLRREGMADCEFECSQITKFLYVGGQRVAENLELLKEKKITRIVNCASAVSPNFHEGYSDIKYLTMNLVDGRQEDISWFVCAVINFIFEGTNRGERTLIHCERGISRSCSFAIAYRMWSTGEKWKPAFEYVQQRRKICSPNTAFMCNLIEIGEVLHGSSSEATLLFRCAYHASYDTGTPVLKLCRNLNSRRILVPATSLLNPQGVYILRCIKAGRHYLYLWQGELAKPSTADIAESLALKMCRVFSSANHVIKIKQGDEHDEFLSFLLKDGPFRKTDDASANYNDFYDYAFGSSSPIPVETERQVSDILMGFGAKSLGTRSPSPDVEKSNVKNALSITLPPLTLETSPTKEDAAKQLQSNNRSTSRERSARRTSNGGESQGNSKTAESDPPSINLPASLSRTNSYRTDDNQQPVVSRQQMLKINNIISSVANESNTNRPKEKTEISIVKESPPRQIQSSQQQPILKSLNVGKTEIPPISDEIQAPFFTRSSSKTKVAPLSELLAAEVARPNSSERRIFGSSPRVVPFTPVDIQSSATPNKVKSPVERLELSPDSKQYLPPLAKKDAKGIPLPLNTRLGLANLSDNVTGVASVANSSAMSYPEISRNREDNMSSDRSSKATTGITNPAKALHKPLLYRAKKQYIQNAATTMYEWESMGVYDDEDLEENEIFLLLCPNMQHHLWIGNNFDFDGAGIIVDDDGKPIMSRLLKWAAKVNIGEVIDKSYVSSGLLKNEVAIHMSGEESDEFWTSFNEGF